MILTPQIQSWPTPQLFAGSAGAPTPPSPLLTDLISYWRLDEASDPRLDAHGSNTLNSAASAVPTSTGKVSALAPWFNRGSNTWLKCASNAGLAQSGTSFTAAFWLRRVNTNNSAHYVGKWQVSGNSLEWIFYQNTIGANVELYVSIDGTLANRVNIASNVAPSVGNWFFVVGWYDAATKNIHIQVNNGSVFSSAVNSVSAVHGGGADFTVGSGDNSGAVNADGVIGPVGFWKRTLTAGERTQLYNGGAGLDYPFQ